MSGEYLKTFRKRTSLRVKTALHILFSNNGLRSLIKAGNPVSDELKAIQRNKLDQIIRLMTRNLTVFMMI